MSIHAGSVIHVAGNNVVDRIQSAGLGDVRVPTDLIREVGNREVVDKVPQDPDFTFTMESFDVSTELEAFLTGKVGGVGSGAAPGATDPDGTTYDWLDCKHVNIASPWKNPGTGSAGVVNAGHIIPGYYPTRIRYRYGVSDNATQEVELGGGAFYYGDAAPLEEFATGDGADTTFPSSQPAVGHRIGGAEGTTFRRVFGVLVNGEPSVRDVDYTETGVPNNATAAVTTITFTVAPPTGADIRFVYFTTTAQSYPQTRHASTLVKPAAVRGRNICVFLGLGATRAKVGGVQAFELEATVDGELEREFCNEEPVGRTINGTDTNGTVTVRAKNKDAFFDLLAKVTGVAKTEVIGWLNLNQMPLEVQIQNPKNPAQIIKTLYVADAVFQVPGTPARVNTPTDFEIRWESKSGTYKAIKGAKS